MAGAVTVDEMIDAEKQAIRNGWTEDRLLDAAGKNLGHAIHRYFTTPGTIIAYLGKGHNAGDALVALEVLRDEYGWSVGFRSALNLQDCAPLVIERANRLGMEARLTDPPEALHARRPLVLLDGLLGTGSSGSPRPPLDQMAHEMAFLRQRHHAQIAAVDLPSGVDANTGLAADGAVTADITFMIANAKVGLLRAAAAEHVGALALVPLEPLTINGDSHLELIAPQNIVHARAPRPFDFHKGMAGKVSILAGSNDYPGAAALAAIGALRGGAGLVILNVPLSVLPAVRCLCPPEIIIKGYHDPRDVLTEGSQARVIGCGLGTPDETTSEQLLHWLEASDLPTVIDADALNLIARAQRHDLLRRQHILTPHPGEFARLAPEFQHHDREVAVSDFCRKYPSTLLLKGCRTLVGQSKSRIRCNASGHPGMASAGMGDLLAGVIGALLAAGHHGHDAAAIGAWLCGRAAERSLWSTPSQSQESMTASDAADHLGGAWHDWKGALR